MHLVVSQASRGESGTSGKDAEMSHWGPDEEGKAALVLSGPSRDSSGGQDSFM